MAVTHSLKEEDMTSVPTELVCVIDRSGSMQSTLKDAQGGLDAFLAQQQAFDGECHLTIWDFDTEHSNPVKRQPIAGAPHYRIEPRGGTALLDAVGKAIQDLDDHAPQMHQVIVVIVTDGGENSSREFNLATIKKKIEQRQGKGWSFVFVGVNIDAFGDAGAMGVAGSTTLVASNFRSAYAATGSSLLRSRTTGEAVNYTDAERKLAGAGSKS